MNYLLSGYESHERFNLLMKLTKIKSEDVIEALREHLVRGSDEKFSYEVNGVSQSNFNRAIVRLNEVACIVEKIKEIDLNQVKSVE
jgi:hypothetical protein